MPKTKDKKIYDIIIVGGGHAGCEAAMAASKMKAKTLLISINLKKVADMPCNPSIGGPGKGHLVKEIDALGGIMGKVADKSLIQIRMLNTSKGVAVQALRAQIEKEKYSKEMLKILKKQKNLNLLDDEVTEILVKNKKVYGVKTKKGRKIKGKAIILATGTFLNGEILIGGKKIKGGGRIDTPAAKKLSLSLSKIGLKLGRLETGTPPRVLKDSVNFSELEIQPGIDGKYSFSFPSKKVISYKKQVPCFLTYTNPKTHQLILKYKNKNPLFKREITVASPRHCPSLDKKVFFHPERERHPIFIEPMGKNSNRVYLQGFWTNFSEDIQEEILHSIKGLEKAKIIQPAYTITYDFVYPWQIKSNLETKKIENLFLAGQINGTSGYEEAATQGIMAGINAALKIKNKKPFILKRSEAYIGVLIDDLITKEHKEPYRIYTGSAEFRLLLRQDNADQRLTHYGFKLGLQNKKRYLEVKEKIKKIEEIKNFLKKEKIAKKEKSYNAWKYLKRPEISIKDIQKILKNNKLLKTQEEILKEVETLAKYEDYIKRQEQQVKKEAKLENMKIPKIDYDKIKNLRNAAKERLKEVEPTTIGQAGRIAGVTPADITALLIYLEKEKRTKKYLEY